MYCRVDTVSAADQVDGGDVLSLLRGKENDVINRIRHVSLQLERLEKQHAVTSSTIETLQLDLKALPNIVRLGRNLDTLWDLTSRIDSADRELNR
jgi:hypothetical protein